MKWVMVVNDGKETLHEYFSCAVVGDCGIMENTFIRKVNTRGVLQERYNKIRR